jgi:hypothetical protein
MAGTALRGAISKLASPSAEAAKTLGRLGIAKSDVFDDQGKVKDFTGVIEQLNAAGATTGDLFKIFGQRAASGVGALMGQLDSQGPDALRSKIRAVREESDGYADESAKTMVAGIVGAFTSVKSSFEAMALSIGKSGFGAALEWTASGIADLFRWIAKLPGPVLALGTGVAGLAAAVGPVLVGVATFAKVASVAAQGLAILRGGIIATTLAKLKLAAVGVASAIKGFALMAVGAVKTAAVIFTSMIPAVTSLTIALLANPIGLVVGAIGLLIGAGFALYKNWDQVSGWFGVVWDMIQTAFDGGVTGVLALMLRISPAGLVYTAWGGVADWLRGVWVDIKAVFADGVDWVTEKLSSLGIGQLMEFLGFGGGSSAEPRRAADTAKIQRVAQGAVAASMHKQGMAHLKVEIVGDREDVRVSVEEARDIDYSMEQGMALGAMG